MKASVIFVCFAVLAAAMLSQAPVAVMAACKPNELTVCLETVLQSKAPTAECCCKLKEQEPCFCDYKKNPSYANYFTSENIKKFAPCGVAVPQCLA